MSKEKILGLDLTKKMVSWALVQSNPNNDEDNKIIDCGGYVFKAGEVPKTGESPNLHRRNCRLTRRTIDKRQARKKAIRKLLIENNMLPSNVIDAQEFSKYMHNRTLIPTWQLRADAMDRILNNDELSRVLLQIASSRGYQFTKAEENSAEDGDSSKMRDATKHLIQRMQETESRTIGEYLARHEVRQKNTHLPKTKSNGEMVLDKDKNPIFVGSYDRSISRYLLKQEIGIIFDRQNMLGNPKATKELQEAYRRIAFHMPDPASTESLVGYCSIFPKEKRAAKTQYEAELHVILTRIINCRIENIKENTEAELTSIASIEDLISFVASKGLITHSELRSYLNLDDNHIFKGLRYKGKVKASKKKKDAATLPNMEEPQENITLDLKEAEKIVFASFKGLNEISRVIKPAIIRDTIVTDTELYNKIAWILTVESGDESRLKRLKPVLDELFSDDVIDEIAESLLLVSSKIFKDHHSLSLKALKLITAEMMQGKRYDEAVAMLGLESASQEKTLFMPALNKTQIECNSPRVNRMVASLRKVVNEVIRYHGAFNKVHIELGRDMNSLNDMKMIESAQNERAKARLEATKKIQELFGDKIKTSSRNITKYMLWEQQNNRCLYTGDVIPLEQLFNYKIDYILPRSRSLDESFGNMTLTSVEAIMAKADKTPFEWLGTNETRWEEFKARITSLALFTKLGKGKVNRFTKENFDESSVKEYTKKVTENDRMYAAKLVKELFEKYMALPESPNHKQQVYTRNSRLTNELKRQWVSYAKQEHITGGRANILNAIIIAFSEQNMVRKLKQYYKWIETDFAKDSKPEFKEPYPLFQEDMMKFLELDRTLFDKNGVERKRLLIAIAPNRTVTGETNGATVISPKVAKKGVKIRQGNAVATTGGDIARCDVYFQDGQNHLVVVYVRDMMKKELPNISTRGIVMKKENFLFSLQNSDLFMCDGEVVIYSFVDSSDGRISGIRCLYGTPFRKTIRKSNLSKVDSTPLGFYSQVKKEPLIATIPSKR